MEYLWVKSQAIRREINDLLSQASLASIYDFARQCYPEECCGLILQQGIKSCQNIQAELHHADPIHYPRTARQGFTLTPADSLLVSRSLNSENPVKIIYHSHPDVGAYFSDEDKKHALWEGSPVYPVDHLVIDIQKGIVICSKLFRFIEGDYQLIAILSGE
jgi:proteasome lid subunit RPN8/RPN11